MKSFSKIRSINGKNFLFIFASVSLLTFLLFAFVSRKKPGAEKILSYAVDPKTSNIKLYWRNDSAKPFRSISNLKSWLQKNNKTLLFAMNGGMYKEDNSPLGLFIQDHKILTRLNTGTATTNFYMKPNGVFFINDNNEAVVCETGKYKDDGKIKYATQSGPMLLIDGKIHPSFTEGSSNLNIRNGVGILPDKRVIFAMSGEPINFYDFAKFFKELGCKNALYLDGFVSRMYLPEKNHIQTDGDFGVIIGVTNN